MPGVFIDVYGPGATLIVHEGAAPTALLDLRAVREAAAKVLSILRPLGVRAVYHKPFARDRSRLGGQLPEIARSPVPAAGDALPEAITIRELAWNLEVRLYDGLSTGIFLDQRDHRVTLGLALGRKARAQASSGLPPPQVLNTFAYTCAFSVAAARAGAITTSVDVSPRYLQWGQRNFELSGLDASQHRFARMGTIEFFTYARRKGLKYDLIILDPPSFAAGGKRGKGAAEAFSSERDYPQLVRAACNLLTPGGSIFASTNTLALCRPRALDKAISAGVKAARATATWLALPPAPPDFTAERGRLATRWFTLTPRAPGPAPQPASPAAPRDPS